jgi:ABC-2 type transport system ATP-binding protein
MTILVHQLTKKFSNGRGIFDLSFEVRKGEVFGYLGPNGAGKSTTIRHLVGFMRPSQGKAEIAGLDCWRDRASIMRKVGYLPGEIAFLEGMNGDEFLKLLEGMRGKSCSVRKNNLIERLQFDIRTPIRKMSKGMKQKVGIVAAFMHDPDILILDEPTSGLDPLMQSTFIDLVLEEKARGKTILMSSHSFTEIDRTCDRAGIIKDGRLITVEDVRDIQSKQRKVFIVTLKSEQDLLAIKNSGLELVHTERLEAQIAVKGNYEDLCQVLSQCGIINMDVRTQDLEQIFMHYYDRRA